VKPLAIDLFCGLGGWAEGLLAEGYRVIGFDIERHDYGTGGYPGQLVIQDVLTLHGSQFRDAAVIVASPPCQEFSYMAMPWSLAKERARKYESGELDKKKLTALFDSCFRIQREASEADGKTIPLIVENVRGAQRWVGRAAWHFGSYYLWGDVPALMPIARSAFKAPGQNWNEWKQLGKVSDHWRLQGVKQPASNHLWYDVGLATYGSDSEKRKAASAEIAKIPLPLAHWIAKCFNFDTPGERRVEP